MDRRGYRTRKFGSWARSQSMDAQVTAAGLTGGVGVQLRQGTQHTECASGPSSDAVRAEPRLGRLSGNWHAPVQLVPIQERTGRIVGQNVSDRSRRPATARIGCSGRAVRAIACVLASSCTRTTSTHFDAVRRRDSAPFLQAISDALSPSFAKGRAALVGDAACTLRPHTGSGTAKAADDAVSLAQALSPPTTDVVHVLDDWAVKRRSAVEPLLLKGPRLARSFGLGYASH
jgi:2-polyprenyl-6-methoxyphenol hydroxylase-like FAD-dependent oxidoreductase